MVTTGTSYFRVTFPANDKAKVVRRWINVARFQVATPQETSRGEWWELWVRVEWVERWSEPSEPLNFCAI
jgi:hypothetical protein